MQRLFINKLKSWKTGSERMPLLLLGARQVGKTWLLRTFGREFYADFAYFSFDQDPDLASFFEKTKDPKRIIEFLGLLQGRPIVPGQTLLILDEIQECNSALNSLKYFCENMPELHVVASGSFLGVALSNPSAFPVGKVNFMRLYPMTFDEFLLADGSESLLAFASKATTQDPLPDIVLRQLQEKLQVYLLVGGMPAVVKTWTEDRDMEKVELRLSELLLSYEKDFSKHAEKRMAPKLWQVWDSIPAQLAKENKKFQYAKIQAGGRAKEYEDAVTWLVNAGLIHKVKCISKPGLPLSAYEEPSTFKIYLGDVGLLRAKAGLQARTLLHGDAFFTEFKGSLVENFFLQEFVAYQNSTVHYWTSDARAEVDFVVPCPEGTLPVEIKSGTAVRSKSLRLYMDRYQMPRGIRCSPLNLREDGGVFNIPLTLISQWNRLLA